MSFIEFEAFWKEQLDYWATQFKWFKDDNEKHMTREELDRELEAYMAQRGFIPMDDRDLLDKEIEEYMAKKGIIRRKDMDEDDLDNEMDDYMSKRGEFFLRPTYELASNYIIVI